MSLVVVYISRLSLSIDCYNNKGLVKAGWSGKLVVASQFISYHKSLNKVVAYKSWFTVDHSQHFWLLFQNSLRNSGIWGILPHILRFAQSRTRCQPLHDYDGGTRRRCVPCCKLGDSPTTRNLLEINSEQKFMNTDVYTTSVEEEL